MKDGARKHPRESNLKPFKPGQSGNPGGRPKDLLTQAIRAKLTPEEADAIAAMLIREAKGGNLKAAELLLDRLEGKARQAVDLSTGEQRRIVLRWERGEEPGEDDRVAGRTREGPGAARPQMKEAER